MNKANVIAFVEKNFFHF